MAERYQFGNRAADERALRLRGYAQSDRADALAGRLQQRDEEDAARNAMMQQRLELERAANERKTNTSEGRRQIAEDNLRRMEQANAAAEKIRAAKEALAEQAQKTKDDRALTVLNHATGFLKDAVGMDYTKPEFDQQLQKLFAGYPQAGEHPFVKEWLGAHVPLRKQVVEDELRQKDEAAKQQTAKAAAQLHYSKTLGQLSDLYAQRREKPNAVLPNGQTVQSAIEGAEELKRAMEEQYPSLIKKTGQASAATAPAAPLDQSNLPPGLTPIPTTLVPETAAPAPAGTAEPVVAAPAEPISTLTGVDAPTPVNPNLGADDSVAPVVAEAAPPVAAAPAPAPVAAAKPAAPTVNYDIHDRADAAIKAGADPQVVMERLKKLGGDPNRLTYSD